MNQHLGHVLTAVAKALEGADLTSTNIELKDGKFYFAGEPLNAVVNPQHLLLLVKLLNPEHETECLLAAELEVALVLFNNKQAKTKREALRTKLAAPGDEVSTS